MKGQCITLLEQILRFKRPVIPGDKLILESTKVSNKRGIWKFGAELQLRKILFAQQRYYVLTDISNDT